MVFYEGNGLVGIAVLIIVIILIIVLLKFLFAVIAIGPIAYAADSHTDIQNLLLFYNSK